MIALTAKDVLPDDGTSGTLAGRVWLPDAGGPAVVAVRGDGVFDVTASFSTVSGLCEADDPAARSRSTPRKAAVVSSSESASREMVAAMFGESGRKRTLSRLCPREVISVLTTGVSSWAHSVRVVNTTGPGREMVQFLSGFEISFGFCVSQR